MSQEDPNRPQTSYGNDPQNPYGGTEGQNPYSTPTPGQGSYSPPDPYRAPQQGSYGAPTPYGVPPQGQYGMPPAAGYAFSGQGYGDPNQVPLNPLPLSEAVKQLPNQYQKIVLHPAKFSFDGEIHKASWDIVWIQILILAVGSAIISLIFTLIGSAVIGATFGHNTSPYLTLFSTATSVGASLLQIIGVPIGIFIAVGIQYLLAKAFKGQGTFLGQIYTYLLFYVPVRLVTILISSLFGVIPVVGIFISYIPLLALGIYAVVLNIFQVQSAHRLSGGKASGVVLIPYAVAILLVVICAVIFAVLLAGILSGSHTTTP